MTARLPALVPVARAETAHEKSTVTFSELKAMKILHPWHKLWVPWNAKDDFKVLRPRPHEPAPVVHKVKTGGNL